MFGRLAHESVVTGDVERDESLHARVADVLELLPVRRVHVSLERPDAGAVPVHAPHVGEPWQVARKSSALGERICGEDSVQIVHAQRFVACRYVELDVAEGAPVQSSKTAMRTAVGKEDVVHAAYSASVDLVSISLLPFRVDEGFRVRKTHGASSAAARLQHRISV